MWNGDAHRSLVNFMILQTSKERIEGLILVKVIENELKNKGVSFWMKAEVINIEDVKGIVFSMSSPEIALEVMEE